MGRTLAPLLTMVMALALSVGMAGAPTPALAAPASCGAATRSELGPPDLTPAGGATARLSRANGVMGTALAVSGGGWPAHATVVIDAYIVAKGQVAYGAPMVAQGVAGADGSLRIGPFRAPPLGACGPLTITNTSGGAAVFLAHTSDDRVRAPMPFTYLPGPTLTSSPQDGLLPTGTPIQVSGTGWEPGERVTVTPQVALLVEGQGNPSFLPATNAAATVTADSQGAFSLTMPPLDEPPMSQVSLDARGVGPRFGVVRVSLPYSYILLPKVYPSIRLDHSQGLAGGGVTVTGDHWAPHQNGYIEYCRGQTIQTGMGGVGCDPFETQLLGYFAADGSGHFAAFVRLPGNAALGPITIQARDPKAPLGLLVYAKGLPFMVVPTWAQAHPRLARIQADAPYLGGALLMVVGALLAGVWWVARRRARRDVSPQA